jgi:tetratricopeptide (TPR) repeat protein
MKRFRAVLAGAAVLLAGHRAAGQEAPYLAELRFVRDLRARHYDDLALEYLERLRKKEPSPELLRELPLELAKTRLDLAAEESDSGKRLAIFEQARAEFEAFLKANPDHPRAGEAKLDVAGVVVLQGKTRLSRVLALDSLEARVAEGKKARQQFVDAARLLQGAADEIDAALAKVTEPKTDADRARRAGLESERARARLAVALNAFDQALTYFDEGKVQVGLERAKKVQEASRQLQQLAGDDASSPAAAVATAWLGRCLYENGEPAKARAKLNQVINSASPSAAEGRRLARYFRLVIQKEQPLTEETNDPKFNSGLIGEASAWLVSYPSFALTPEGCGVRYLLAELHRNRAADAKTPRLQRDGDLDRARRLLREVERTENDFTDRARRLKIAIIKDQGGFSRDVASLPTFEDCYARAQFEILSLSEDSKPAKDSTPPDGKKIDESRDARLDTVIAALRRGLSLPDATSDHGKAPPEVNNARAMLAFYCLNRHQYREAIEAGEGFARGVPRSGQAAMAAVYALDAYGQMLGRRERENALPEELGPDREKMLALARYSEERWPRELAGDVARHQIALALLREARHARQPADQLRLLGEAVAKLESVGKDYPSYGLARYQLADACLQAEHDGVEPLPGAKPGDWRQRAVAVLAALPEPGSGDPVATQAYATGKLKLGWEMYKDKRVDDALRLGDDLAKKLPGLPLDDAGRQQLAANVADLRLFAAGAAAEADFGKGRYAEVLARLDPLAAAVNRPDAGPESKLVADELRKNLQLGSALLSMDLRANVQLGKLERVEPVLRALQSLGAEDDPGGSARILQMLVFVIKQQVEELDRRGDKENKDKAVAGFTKILDRVTEKPDKLDPPQRLLLARCYANMDQHRRAADLLEKVATPAEKGAQLLYARELRLAKEPEKARPVVNEILGTPSAPGWGTRNVEALLEDVALTEDEGKYDKAALKANDIVRRLLPSVTRDNALKEKYLEAYYHVVYCLVKDGQARTDPALKQKALQRAAGQTLELNKKWPNFGGGASSRRFTDLLDREPDFKQTVERLKVNEP